MSHDRIQDIWRSLLPRDIADQPCLYTWRKNRFQSSSFKDLNAQAHCAAAFLMDSGLQKGDVLAVLSEPSLPLLAIDLALQFLGGVGLYLPGDLNTAQVEEAVKAHKARFVFVGDHESYLQHGELAALKPELKKIFLETEDAEGLSSEKLITYDIMVLRGKSVWREQAQRLADCKEAVQSDDTYALFAHNPKSPLKFAPVRYARVLEHLHTAQARIADFPTGSVLTLASTDRYLQHIHGGFAPLSVHRPLYILDADQLAADHCTTCKPALLVGQPQDIETIYERLPAHFLGKDDPKPIEKAQELIEIREAAQAEGKKAPFFKNLKYKSHNKGLYKQIRKKLGGQLGVVICDHDEPQKHIARFFRESELPIEVSSMY